METQEEKLSDDGVEQVTSKSLFIKTLVKTGAIVLLISVFIFFIGLIFSSHTYSYHL
jgi:hypothetical protein